MLTRIEDGTATVAEVAALLRPDEESEDPEPKERPRSQPKTPQVPGSGYSDFLSMGQAAIVRGGALTTDPRVVASGRNRRRLSTPTTASDAEEAFFHVTADTHGGKTRKRGKDGKQFVSKGGKRIRKR
jgi:hypothetical protein